MYLKSVFGTQRSGFYSSRGVLTSGVAITRGSTVRRARGGLYRGVSSRQGWPLRGVPLYVGLGVAFIGASSRQGWPLWLRGSTVYLYTVLTCCYRQMCLIITPQHK